MIGVNFNFNFDFGLQAKPALDNMLQENQKKGVT